MRHLRNVFLDSSGSMRVNFVPAEASWRKHLVNTLVRGAVMLAFFGAAAYLFVRSGNGEQKAGPGGGGLAEVFGGGKAEEAVQRPTTKFR